MSTKMNGYMDEQMRKRNASLLLQSMIVITMTTSIWLWFTSWRYRYAITIPLSLLMFIVVAWEVRKHLTLQDGFVGLVLGFLFLYPRFVTYPGSATGFYTLHVILVSFALGMSFRYLQVNNWTFRLLAAFVLLPFLYSMLVLRINVDNSFFAMNRNSPPLYLISIKSLLALNEKLSAKKWLTVTPSFLTVWVAWYSRSRAGLVVAIWLAGILVVHNILIIGSSYWKKATKTQRFFLAGAVVLLSLVFIAIITRLIKTSRFASVGFSSNGRLEIWKSYLSAVDIKSLLIGYAPESTPDIGMHNSYLYMTSTYGMISIIFFVGTAVALHRLKKVSWFYVMLMGIWLIYSLAEDVLPFSYGLFVFLPLLMLAFPPKRLNQTIWTLVHHGRRVDNLRGEIRV